MHPKFAEHRQEPRRGLPLVSAISGLVCVGLVFVLFDNLSGAGLVTAFRAAVENCQIKGNIDLVDGSRIYYLPGQSRYAAIRIQPAGGERLFCSEEQAHAAGWHRARD
ncbi:MAG TPA: hypothetical protein VM468_13685 [Mycoplana sp.]|nr:hypothetical protein [Mycoplana sp.]